MKKNNLLIEICTEEIPQKDLRSLAESFSDHFNNEINNAHIKHGKVNWFATPRRLALKIFNISTVQAERKWEKRGPDIKNSFDKEGKPNKKAKLWAMSCGITMNHAKKLVNKKGEWLLYRRKVKGRSTKEILKSIVKKTLEKLPRKKWMRWGDKETKFVRPVHTVTMLFGNNLIKGTVLGIPSTRTMHGHRFMGKEKFHLDNTDEYPRILKKSGNVIADYEYRKNIIKQDFELLVQFLYGNSDINIILMEEVVSLVEWPVVLKAKFEEKFLAIPTEAIIHTMKKQQKYFPIYNTTGKLLPYFIFVANIESTNPAPIISGNEKVIRPRLEDAYFLFQIDRKKNIEENIPFLETVLFQKKLGTMREKTHRIQIIAGWISGKIEAEVKKVTRAGLLCKCDLITNMIFEFQETQGAMGMHYARYYGEHEEVAVALNEHYKPRFSFDSLPDSLVACTLSIADKIDNITGLFIIGKNYKKKDDPFALRRAALGVLRIITERKIPIDIKILTEKSQRLYENKINNRNVVDDVVYFLIGRFRTWYQEKGYAVDTINSVLSRKITKPAELDLRVKAVSYFRTFSEAKSLSVANKRVSKILKKYTDTINKKIHVSFMKDFYEMKLAMNLVLLKEKIAPLYIQGRYQEALLELTTLHNVVNTFFENVLVLIEEEVLRINRLTLLRKLRDLFLEVADLSFLKII